MEKFRAFKSHLPSLPSMSSSPSTKLTKAFRFNGTDDMMKRSERSRNPFLDGPALEQPSLPRVDLILHLVACFFTFLAICTTGALAGFQAKWFAVSGGTGFVLFLLLVSFLLSVILVVVPIVYDKFDRLKRPAQFLNQTRSTLILHVFGTSLMLLSAFIVIISAFTVAGCKNPENDPHASLGDDYETGLKQWCTTKKASAVFEWLSFGAWAALLVLTILKFRKERRREPSFIPPSSPLMAPTSYSAVNAPVSSTTYRRDDEYADKQEVYEEPVVTPYGYTNEMARPSVDAYGAFDGDMPGGERGDEPSRTMQLAYTDPYAQIRASLMNDPNAGYGQSPGLYANGGLPQPPTYGGYR